MSLANLYATCALRTLWHIGRQWHAGICAHPILSVEEALAKLRALIEDRKMPTTIRDTAKRLRDDIILNAVGDENFCGSDEEEFIAQFYDVTQPTNDNKGK
jgi:hypothetical protein